MQEQYRREIDNIHAPKDLIENKETNGSGGKSDKEKA